MEPNVHNELTSLLTAIPNQEFGPRGSEWKGEVSDERQLRITNLGKKSPRSSKNVENAES